MANQVVVGTGITKQFGTGDQATMALSGVDVTVNKGEFVAIMGASGSGKSTLLFALSGVDTIDQGSITLDGVAISSLKPDQLSDLRRRRTGFIFQQPTMLRNLNILDNILLPVMPRGNQLPKAVERAKKLMEQTGIQGMEERDITQVSGGQLQRAGICRALMGDPAIVFADEPTGALNSRATSEVMDLLTEINQAGTAILLVTHDNKVAVRASRVIFMKDGTIIDEVTFTTDDLAERTNIVAKKMAEIGA